MDKIDYTIAFEELNMVNKAFFKHTNYLLPVLNPVRFEQMVNSQGRVVVMGRLSGQHYLIGRTEYTDDNGDKRYHYTGAIHVRPEERIIIDWETL